MTVEDYGLITGLGFSITFSIFGVFAGAIVDATSRGSTILGLSVIFAGILTLISSYSESFLELLILRALLGMFQAFGAPASVYIITTYFPKINDRPIANAAYTVGLYLGAGFSSLSTIFASKYGWSMTYYVLGFINIGFGLLFEIMVDIPPDRWSHKVVIEANLDDSQSYDDSVDDITSHEKDPLLQRVQMPVETLKRSSNFAYSVTHRSEKSEILEGFPAKAYHKTDELSYTSNDKREEVLNTNHGQPNEAAIHAGTEDIHTDRREEYPAVEGTKEYEIDAIKSEFTHNINSNQSLIIRNDNMIIKDGSVSDDESDDEQFSLKDFCSTICKILFVYPNVSLLLLASCSRFVAGITVFVYTPILMMRKFPLDEYKFSMFNAIVVLSCGSISSIVGSRIGQNMVIKEGLSGLAKLAAISCLLSIIPFAVAMKSSNFWLSVCCLALGYLFGEGWMSLSMVILQGLVQKNTQGLSMSIYLFLNWNAAAVVVGNCHMDEI
jgi:hypothetical protein